MKTGSNIFTHLYILPTPMVYSRLSAEFKRNNSVESSVFLWSSCDNRKYKVCFCCVLNPILPCSRVRRMHQPRIQWVNKVRASRWSYQYFCNRFYWTQIWVDKRSKDFKNRKQWSPNPISSRGDLSSLARKQWASCGGWKEQGDSISEKHPLQII